MKNLLKILIVAGMIVIGINILLFGAYFYVGSLEEFPTEERIEGIRWLCGVIIIFSLLGELVLWSILRRCESSSRTKTASHKTNQISRHDTNRLEKLN